MRLFAKAKRPTKQATAAELAPVLYVFLLKQKRPTKQDGCELQK